MKQQGRLSDEDAVREIRRELYEATAPRLIEEK
jgi:hypothetical protein